MKQKVCVFITILYVLFVLPFPAFAQAEPVILIKTNMGNIKIKLYNNTPQHRDNMLRLAEQKFYNGVLFHRVIKDFMIQTGDPSSKNAEAGKQLGMGGPGYNIPAEIRPENIHKKGAVAAARQGDQTNPSRASSGSQFYIVVGKTYGDDGLNQIEQKIQQNLKFTRMRTYMMLPENKYLRDLVDSFQMTRNTAKLDSLQILVSSKIDSMHRDESAFKFTPQQRETYKTTGGTPFLDMTYTVFGEVIEGLEIVDQIAQVPVLQGDRPVKDVVIESMKVLK